MPKKSKSKTTMATRYEMSLTEMSQEPAHCQQPIVRLPASQFTPRNSSKACGEFALDVRDGKLVGKYGWKIVGYGKAPYTNDGDDLALMLEKTEQPNEGERIWHHCARWMFEDQWGEPNKSSKLNTMQPFSCSPTQRRPSR